MGEVWVIASGKGGTGKSTLAVNLGIVFAKGGTRTVLVDLDLGLRCLDLYLGIEDRVMYDVMDVMDGNCRSGDALIKHPALPLLQLLPAAQNRVHEDVCADRLKCLCDELLTLFDLVILDLPPGIGVLLPCAARAADKTIIVANDDPVSLRDAERAVDLLMSGGAQGIGLVLNRIRYGSNSGAQVAWAEMVAETVGIRLWGMLPEDPDQVAAVAEGKPIGLTKADSAALRGYREIATRLARKG